MMDKLLNPDILYQTVLDATDSPEKADQLRAEWMASRSKLGKDPNTTVNLNAMDFAAMLSEIIPSDLS